MIMKNRILLFACGLCAFFAFIGCSSVNKTSFVFDETGNKIVETLQMISNEEFQEKIVGRAIKYEKGYEILNDGTLDSIEYCERKQGATGAVIPPPPYYFENDSTYFCYYSYDAYPREGFKKTAYTYDGQSGCVVESDGRKAFQILDIGDDFIKTIVHIGYYSIDKKEHYGYFTYRFMTDEELKRVQDIYTLDYNEPKFSRW